MGDSGGTHESWFGAADFECTSRDSGFTHGGEHQSTVGVPLAAQHGHFGFRSLPEEALRARKIAKSDTKSSPFEGGVPSDVRVGDCWSAFKLIQSLLRLAESPQSGQGGDPSQ